MFAPPFRHAATPRSRGLRTRLRAVAVAVAVTFLGLAFVRAQERQTAEQERLGERAQDYALTATRALDASLREARTLLLSIDRAVEANGRGAPSGPLLQALMRNTPAPYDNIFTLDRDGRLEGTARDTSTVTAMATEACLLEARSRKQFVVCAPTKRPASRGGQWEFVLLQPCADRDSAATDGFVGAVVALDSLEPVRIARRLPAGSVLTMLDSTGIVRLRTLEADRWIGKLFPNFPQRAKDLQPLGSDTVVLSEIDRESRLFGTAAAEQVPWRIYAGIPVASVFGPSRRQFIQDLCIGAVASLLVLILGYWLTARIVRPIEGLTADARAISEGDMARRSTVDSGDEVGELARTFNQMADAIGERNAQLAVSQEQLRQVQKLDALGAFAGGIAHEFNNYLSSILGHAELALAKSAPQSDSREEIAGIITSTQRAAELTRQVMVFSRRQVVDAHLLDAATAVANHARLLERLLGERVTLTCHVASSLGPVLIDPGQLEQVLMNLVVNARDAMPDGGSVAITVDRATEADRQRLRLGERPFVRISVRDSGPGIPQDVRSHIFEPFFTTKDREHGTGLGLSISYGILQSAGGAIELDTSTESGATFRIYLPERDAPMPSKAEPTVRDPLPGGREDILLVEDDASVAEVARRLLARAGYQVTVAANGAIAMDLLARRHFDLLLSDVVMPGMSGAALAKDAVQIHGPLRVLLMSGYPDDDLAAHEIASQRVSFLAKPFSQASLLDAVRSALDAPARVGIGGD